MATSESEQQIPSQEMLRPEKYKDEFTMPSPSAPVSKLVGLLCPNCRHMCRGVPALQEHLKVCKGAVGASSAVGQPPSNAGPTARDIEEPRECHICDKSLKSCPVADNASGDGGFDRGYQAGDKQDLQIGGQSSITSSNQPQGKKSGSGDGGQGLSVMKMKGNKHVGGSMDATISNNSAVGQPPSNAGPTARDIEEPQECHICDEPLKFCPAADNSSGNGGFDEGYQDGDKLDLQKQGMKFGGQPSITSSNQHQGKKSGSGDGGQGLSVMKMKENEHVGGPVSIKDATSNSNKNSSSQPSSSGESSKAYSAIAKAPTQSLTAQPCERTMKVKARGRPKKSPTAAPGEETGDDQDDAAPRPSPQKRPRIARISQSLGIQRISNYIPDESDSDITDVEECPICDTPKYFNSYYQLKNHMKQKHKIL